MKLYLKINGNFQLMKMDAGSDIALNFSHDNLDNPTNYISEFSYNLKVPCCAENNKLFGNFLHLDSLIQSGSYNPAKSMEYIVTDNAGSLISTGTAYVKTISNGYYNLSLTGSLSRIFNRLLNSGWSDYNTDLEYSHMTDWLMLYKSGSGSFVSGINVIDKDVVYASWMIPTPLFGWNEIQETRLLLAYGLARGRVTETQCWIASIVGFAPTAQGKLKGFSNDKWVESGTIEDDSTTPPSTVTAGAFSLLPVLCSARNVDDEPIQDKYKFEDDESPIECQMGEYRSYYQQPFIYVFRLWQMYQAEFARITDGYSLILDDRWFSADNPQLANLVYMLPKLWDESNSEILGTMELEDGTATKNLPSAAPQTSSATFLVTGLMTRVAINQYPQVKNKKGAKITYDFNIELTVRPNQSIPGNAVLYGSKYNFLMLNVTIRDDYNLYNGYPAAMANHKYAIIFFPSDETVTMDMLMEDSLSRKFIVGALQQGAKLVQAPYIPGSTVWEFAFNDTLSAINHRSSFSADVSESRTRIDANIAYHNNNTPFMYVRNGATTYTYNSGGTVELKLTNVEARTTYATRTGKILSLGNLFRDEKPFGVLLKYSKLMHLLWIVDDDAKTVTVKRSVDFYGDIVNGGEGITNISNLVDMSKGIEITPLSWTDNKVLLNYNDSDMDYIKEYSERYGLTYGSKSVITANEIKSTTKKLLCTGENDTINPSALLSETVVPIGQLLSVSCAELGYVENTAMMLNQSDGESENYHGCFLFRKTNGALNSRLCGGWRNDGADFALITDDLDYEYNSDEWAWHGPGAVTGWHEASWVKCYVMPRFDTTSPDGSVSIHFAAVRELYSEQHNKPSSYLYEATWKEYIEEVYNIQNKTIQAYAHINKSMFDLLRRNPLVQIGNCLYLLTKLEGWGEHAALSKMTLRQIYDLDKLTGGAKLAPRDAYFIMTEDNEEIICEDGDNLIQEN